MASPNDCLRVCSLAVVIALLSFQTSSGQGLGVAGNLVSTANGTTYLQVRTVVPGSLAHRVGIFVGDEIYSINQFSPGNAQANQRAIAAGRGALAIVVNRRGQRLTLGNARPLPVNPVVTPPSLPYGNPLYPGGYPAPRSSAAGPELQIDLQESPSLNGNRLTIIAVTPGGLGARYGLRVGDVIESINSVRVTSVETAARAYIYRNGQIVLRIVRNGQPKEIRITQQVTRKPAARKPLRKLGLKAVRNNSGLIVITGDESGLGKQLGITRGTVIRKINGTVVRTQGDLNRVDEAIAAGKIQSLEIEIERSNARSIIRYPRN